MDNEFGFDRLKRQAYEFASDMIDQNVEEAKGDSEIEKLLFAAFLIHALDWRDLNDLKWRRLVVECDGHEYHERTKKQAKRDRSRDHRATLDGYDCFRFTGSEIWCDPWGCAEQISEWAGKGWGI